MNALERPMPKTPEVINADLPTFRVFHHAPIAPEINAEVNPSEVKDPDEGQFLHRLRNGEEDAFRTLIDRYHAKLFRMAQTFVSSRAVAEEVVQETWLAVFESISKFEGRSSVKTWLFQILSNKAKTKGVRESRYMSFSGAVPQTEGGNTMEREPVDSVDALDNRTNVWEENTPERLLMSKELRVQIEKRIQELPTKQRQVMVLRDVEGLNSDETCAMLGITTTNQRVLLHRARGKVRTMLHHYFQGLGSPV